MKIETSPTTLGSIVSGVDLRAVPGSSQADAVLEALADRGVLVFREQGPATGPRWDLP